MSETTHRATRLALASLLTVALVSQLLIGMSRSDLSPVDFFSFFTVLSNVAAVVMLVMLSARPGRDESTWFAVFRGAVTVYMVVTGLVYAVILAPRLADVAVPEPWIDWCIHVVGPVAIALDWALFPPPRRLPREVLWIWLLFPAAYLAYSLVRGGITGWYPYPFLDHRVSNGYLGVAGWSLLVLVIVLAITYLCYWWANRQSKEDGS